MAEHTKAPAAKAPAAKTSPAPVPPAPVPQAPAPAPAPAPAAAAPNGEQKAKRGQHKTHFDTAEAAMHEAKTREKGPKRAFKLTRKADGKVEFLVEFHEICALGRAAQVDGLYDIEELGVDKTRRTAAPKAVDRSAVEEFLKGKSEKEVEAILAAIGYAK